MGCLVESYDGSYILQDLKGKIKLEVCTVAPILESGRYLLPNIFFIAEGHLDEVSMSFTVKNFVLPRYYSAIGAPHSVRLNDCRTEIRVIIGELLKYNSN
jgi:hypothetical protein